MKSKNNLTITGVVSRLRIIPERGNARFILVHNFGGGRPPLYLNCIAPEPLVGEGIHDGDLLRVDANLRPGKSGVQAFIKTFITIHKSNNHERHPQVF